MRTLWTYEQLSTGPLPNRPGRPEHDPREKRSLLFSIARAWRTLGRDAGWRPVWVLVGRASKWLVQRILSALKARRRRRLARQAAARRTHVDVLARDALWSLDSTHLGRQAGRAIEAEVLRDPATRSSDVGRVGRPSDAHDVIDALEHLEQKRGALPLVLLADNGAAYGSAEVERYLAARHVVRLKSLPHTPQHNPWVERTNGELKATTGLGKGAVIASVSRTAAWIRAACERLNRRPRACLGDRSPA